MQRNSLDLYRFILKVMINKSKINISRTQNRLARSFLLDRPIQVAPLARMIAFGWSSQDLWNFLPMEWLKAMPPLEGNNCAEETFGLSIEWGKPALSLPSVTRERSTKGNNFFFFFFLKLKATTSCWTFLSL